MERLSEAVRLPESFFRFDELALFPQGISEVVVQRG